MIAVSAFIAVFAIMAIGVIFEQVGERLDRKRFPQVGSSFDIGGRALNLDCEGQGSPVVILESGLAVPGYGWIRVAPEVAKFTRVCWYDRAGYGWSDTGSSPRNGLAIASDLHALLAAANVRPPYVMVGHSMGGYDVRVFAGQHRDEVAGMVLVDASHEDQESHLPQSVKRAAATMERETRMVPWMLRLGVVRAMPRNEALLNRPGGLTKAQNQMLDYLALQPKFFDAVLAEYQARLDTAAQVRTAGGLGSKPLIVLTAGGKPELPPGVPEADIEKFAVVWINQLQKSLAGLSDHGRQIVVQGATHMMPYEKPDAVVDAVRQVVRDVRGSI